MVVGGVFSRVCDRPNHTLFTDHYHPHIPLPTTSLHTPHPSATPSHPHNPHNPYPYIMLHYASPTGVITAAFTAPVLITAPTISPTARTILLIRVTRVVRCAARPRTRQSHDSPKDPIVCQTYADEVPRNCRSLSIPAHLIPPLHSGCSILKESHACTCTGHTI